MGLTCSTKICNCSEIRHNQTELYSCLLSSHHHYCGLPWGLHNGVPISRQRIGAEFLKVINVTN